MLFCFTSPRDRIERYTFLYGCCSLPLVYAPPADLIMSMPPETRYNNFSPLQWHSSRKQHWADPGSGSRFLELTAASVPLWTSQIRILATLKGENGSTLEESAAPCPLPPGRKGSFNTVWSYHIVLSAFLSFHFLLWERLFTLGLSVLEGKKSIKFLMTSKSPFFRKQGTCKQEHLMAQHMYFVKGGIYQLIKQTSNLQMWLAKTRGFFFCLGGNMF